jgi:acetylornithine deacetylase/succinyl-diaminopimelate desuccinylase-like protein
MLERLGVRPTLEVNGLLSGFTGEGEKNVLPARAMAKISMRLVPYQNPLAIEEGFREYIAKKAPPTVRWAIKRFSSVPAVLMSRNSSGMQAACKALEAAFGVKPIFRLGGGTLPVIGLVQQKLGVDAVMMGFSLPEDNLHAPNEKYYLPNFPRAIEAYIRFFDAISHER